MDNWTSEFRQIVRSLAVSPGFVIMAAVAIGLGVGATTMMFSITRGVLQDLPFEEADRLIAMEVSSPERGIRDLGITSALILQWRSEQRSLTELGGSFTSASADLSGEGIRAVRRQMAAITPNTFSILRVEPLIGRAFLAEDAERPEPGILISHDLWTSHFGADPLILDRSVQLNGTPRQILGVMPAEFGFPRNEDIWEPAALSLEDTRRYKIFGRLADNASMETARAEFDGLVRRLAVENPERYEGAVPRLGPYVEIQMGSRREASNVFHTMLLVVSFVLLIACANVANLLLARAVAMGRESALRVALGASRGRVVTRFLMDAMLVAGLGGLLGVGIAYGGVQWFNAQVAAEVGAFWVTFSVDRTVLLFSAALVGGAGLAAGIIPGLRASDVDVASVLKEQAGRGGLRLGRASRILIGAEVALSCGLLLLAGLMVKGVSDLVGRDVTFDTARLVTAHVNLRAEAYPDPEARAGYFARAIEALESLPSVEAASLVSALPGMQSGGVRAIVVEGEDYGEGAAPDASVNTVSADLLETLGLRVTRGRALAVADDVDSDLVALVSESFIRTRFPNGEGLGLRIAFESRDTSGEEDLQWRTVVGVVPDAGIALERGVSADLVLIPVTQVSFTGLSLVARVRGQASGAVPGILAALQAVDPQVPLEQVAPLDEISHNETVTERTFGVLFMVFGGIALLLAAVGLYGVVAFTIGQSLREVGIRMALGAPSVGIVRHYVRQSLTPVLVGVVLGLGVGALVAPPMGEALFGSDPMDPLVYSTVPLVLVFAGLMAAVAPVLQVLRGDPISALRQD